MLPQFVLIRSNMSGYSVDVPCGPWILLSTFLSAICGLFCAPYLASCSGRTSRCFYDAACVNQVDPVQRERGIYGIGGFLALSGQLWILWSPPYLSRLWCVSGWQIRGSKRAHVRCYPKPETLNPKLAFMDVVRGNPRG